MSRSYRYAHTDTLNNAFGRARLLLAILGVAHECFADILYDVDCIWGPGGMDEAISEAVESRWDVRILDFGDYRGFDIVDIVRA